MDQTSHRTIGDVLAAQARSTPAAPAILALNSTALSYRELWDQVELTRAQLHAAGLGSSDRVALMLGNGPELAAAFLSLASTLACAPLNPASSEQELERDLASIGVAAVVVERGQSSALRAVAARQGVRIIELDPGTGAAGTFTLDLPVIAPPEEFDPPGPDTVALLLHTSGTTSRPKLVPLTHANLTASAANVAASLELTSTDRCLNVMPLFHIHGLVAAVLASLTAGGSTVCTPGLDPARFADWLAELQPTWYTAVPTMHQAIVAKLAPQTPVASSLRFVRSSSAALPRAVFDALEHTFGCPAIEAYGMTEASHQMATNPLPPGERRPGSVGRASGVELTTLDASGKPLAAGVEGEVAIRGPGVFAGYEGNEAATAAAFVDGWFRTGDLGVIDAVGYLTLKGRSKEIINRGGEKVSPFEVEEALLEHEAVEQAAVFAMPHPTLGETVGAAVVLRAGHEATVEALRRFAATRLAEFKVPQAIVVLDELPKGATGKVQRIGMAERLELSVPPPSSGAAARTPLERELVAAWQDLFRLEHVGVDDDFFALGGDSLVAAELFGWIVENGYATEDIPLGTLLWAPTVALLADALERGTWAAQDGLVTVRDGDETAPLFCFAGENGQIVRFGPLARELDDGRAWYAVAGPAELDPATPISVERLATEAHTRIRATQPSGPYHLFGRCMGAVVALEVARLMLEDGEEVAFLGLLDPIGERTGRAQHYWRRVRKEVEQRRLVRTVASSVSTRVGLRLGRVEPYEVTELHLAMIEAGQAYTPSPYPGAATLFRTIGYLSPASFWEALVTGGLQVEPPFTPVGHAYVEVAPQLALALERAGTTRHDRVVATTI